MNTFNLVLELFLYGFGIHILLKKGELGILYLPVLFFIETILTAHLVTAFVYYAMVSVILLKLLRRNGNFIHYNIFSFFLIIYYLLLLARSTNLEPVRQDIFNVIWFFMSLPLMASIYEKHFRQAIFRELERSSFIILSIFIANVLVSTYFKFNPTEMYGISSGLFFGNMYATDFNIVAIAVFIVLLGSVQHKNLVFLLAVIVSFSFVCLSMRRSVMAICGTGIFMVVFFYLTQNIRKIFLFAIVSFTATIVIMTQTNFSALFLERYELRNLEERSLNEEQRMFEYDLLYDDVALYDRYSPIIGYQLFNSPGNYGGGKFYDRSLHGDLPSIFHSSGLIGVLLYLLMIFTAFARSFRAAKTSVDRYIIAFCIVAFITYCLTGRYTQVGSMVLLFLAAQLPLAQSGLAAQAQQAEPFAEPCRGGITKLPEHSIKYH